VSVAFVLSGGGSLGAVQVGMLQALAERSVVPDLLIGTSAGALNAAFLAAGSFTQRRVDDLAGVWASVRRRHVFPIEPVRHLRAVGGLAPSLCDNIPLRRLIERNVPYGRLEDAAIPVHVVAADLLSGREVLLSEGDAVSAVLASAAIPAVFPPVERDGLILVDGGVADNTAISHAVALGATEVYVLPAGFPCALERPPATALGTAVQALSLLIEQRLILEVSHFADSVDLRVLPPLCPLNVASTDFHHTEELMQRARGATGRWLDEGGPSLPDPDRFLSLHRHLHRPELRH
jgi:NTE family protein